MKYICIDNGSVEELVSGRDYQSVDFERADQLIQGLKGKVSLVRRIGKIIVYQDEEGVFLTTLGLWKDKKYLVIDCEKSSLFTQLKSADSLTAFQKLLRFCVKLWSGGSVYNKNERIVTGTSKAIVFPMPFIERDPFRIAIEREPMKDRLNKRDMGGRFLLVYKSGTSHADSSTEEADETNFRKAFERLQSIYSEIPKMESEVLAMQFGSQVTSTDLSGSLGNPRSSHLPFLDWLPLLSKQQHKFINAPWNSAHRLIGPAGTGKTLSLILRTISILEQA
jgi:hypothetical protein